MHTLELIILWAIPLILAVTVHEAAHGWVADKLGDRTARSLGRVTFNPIPHIDPVGTIGLPVLMMLTTGFIFGWAKPVPVDFRNLNNPKKDMVWVALAGPGVNLLMALGWAFALKLALVATGGQPTVFEQVCELGIFFNLILMSINLIPLPPLDGGKVAIGLLPLPQARMLARLEQHGLFLVIGLMLVLYYTGGFQALIGFITAMSEGIKALFFI